MAVCVDMVISPALKGLEGVAEFANDVEEGLVVANVACENDEGDAPVSYTHLTLPTNREV